MPTWVYGIAMAFLLLLRPAIFGWLFGFIRREVVSLWRVSAEERLQRDAAAWRDSTRRAVDDDPGPPTP
jgi:hypothetical protein